MRTDRLRDALGQLRAALAPPEADGQLLARFLASRDECAFAALVRRHGPMVLGVCRRVLRHVQDAEDAFQATFLVLARKAASVRKRNAVGSWLYAVACRTARRLRDVRAQRWAREQQVGTMPHPQTGPSEPQDWRPLLDEALSRLAERHRAPVVLCDLQGLSRREAARQLGLAHRTLSRRLVKGRTLLAQRLSRRGVTLSGGALAVLLSEGAACAQVPRALALATAKAASLVAAGQLAAVATPVAALTMGVLRAMWIAKVKVVVAAVFAVAALGAGVAYHSEGVRAEQVAQASPAKPRSELERLRREVELLKLNLEVMLEKVRAQEQELRELRGKKAGPQPGALERSRRIEDEQLRLKALEQERAIKDRELELRQHRDAKEKELELSRRRDLEARERELSRRRDVEAKERELKQRPDELDGVRRAEEAMRALRDAKDDASRRRALESLDQALRTLRQQIPGARHDEKKSN
jgi:RNA polymerase sigma factor (sigma-70 family)